MDKAADACPSLAAGRIVRGKVTGLSDDTAFVDVEGVEGRVYADIGRAWNCRGAYPWPFAVGYEGLFAVLGLDWERRLLALGYVSPAAWATWQEAGKRFPAGSRHRAEVGGVFSSGVFAVLGEGIAGWLPVAELQRRSGVSRPQDFFSVGDTIEVVVLSVEPERMEMIVGLI